MKINIQRPKIDFDNKITIDKHYIELLKNFLSECSKELNAQKKPTGYRKAKLEIEAHEATLKQHIQIKLLNDKLYHFHNVFMPDYTLKEAEFDATHKEVLAKAVTVIGADYIGDTLKAAQAKLKILVDEFNRLDEKDKEGKMFLFRMIQKELNNIWNGEQEAAMVKEKQKEEIRKQEEEKRRGGKFYTAIGSSVDADVLDENE